MSPGETGPAALYSLAPYPHPALRATFSRKREKGCSPRPRAMSANASKALRAPPLPLAGEGWGEGDPQTLDLLLA
jgi:hypothetical protein